MCVSSRSRLTKVHWGAEIKRVLFRWCGAMKFCVHRGGGTTFALVSWHRAGRSKISQWLGTNSAERRTEAKEKRIQVMTERYWVAHYLEGYGRQNICSLKTHVLVDIWKPFHWCLVRSKRSTFLLPRTRVTRNARRCWADLHAPAKAKPQPPPKATPEWPVTPLRPKPAEELSCQQNVWVFYYVFVVSPPKR